MSDVLLDVFASWKDRDGNVNSTADILSWIKKLNQETHVRIQECSIKDSDFWFYDDYNGEILNRKRSFFSIKGIRRFVDEQFVGEQPIILQPEIGYLGIICKRIHGVLNFLMQAKIEPGNVNCVQISPTIQATKSNFIRAHGGALPKYFEYFEHSSRHHVLYDQIQSEQAGRFYKKRNRNMIMLMDEDVPVYPGFAWMTLGQIKELMKIDNLVNMDTRTVLSGLPLAIAPIGERDCPSPQLQEFFDDGSLYSSMFETSPVDELPSLYQQINDFKMFREVDTAIVPLNQLADWKVSDRGVDCRKPANFKVRYYNIDIDGREVQCWTQPLFKAIGRATLGLFVKRFPDGLKFLVAMRDEIGSFDKLEIGPSVQWEPLHQLDDNDEVGCLFQRHVDGNTGVLTNVTLSEEGGRFYHEQNSNIIVMADADELLTVPDGYAWVSYRTLNYLTQVNNCLNIQLRNLLSLLDFPFFTGSML